MLSKILTIRTQCHILLTLTTYGALPISSKFWFKKNTFLHFFIGKVKYLINSTPINGIINYRMYSGPDH
jgi:hypothetical protein